MGMVATFNVFPVSHIFWITYYYNRQQKETNANDALHFHVKRDDP